LNAVELRVTAVERHYMLVVEDRFLPRSELYAVLLGDHAVADVRLHFWLMNRSVPGPSFALFLRDHACSPALEEAVRLAELEGAPLVFELAGERTSVRGVHKRFDHLVLVTHERPPEDATPLVLHVGDERLELSDDVASTSMNGVSLPFDRGLEQRVRAVLRRGGEVIVKFAR
jgi:hypothetical protein